MPNIRCRNYDDSGAPIKGGCSKVSTCTFVHPSQPQWQNAMPSPATNRGKHKHRDSVGRNDSGSNGSSAWGGPTRNHERDNGWAATAGSSRVGAAPPTGPRQRINSSASGWGSVPFKKNGWGDDTADMTSEASGSNVNVSNWRPPPNDASEWGAPIPNLDWGAPPPDWSAPPAGWGSSVAPQKPPERVNPDKYIWGDAQSRGRKEHGAATPQTAYVTPRTPRSPSKSPQEDRRRSSVMSTPSDDPSASANAPKEIRKPKEALRTLSWGIPAPIATAGLPGVPPSKPNPFAFPEYTPPEKMNVDQPDLEAGELDVEVVEDLHKDVVLQEGPLPPIPQELESQWKDFTRTLSQTVSLHIESRALGETREKQRQMQRSRQYQSASRVEAHKEIERIRQENDQNMVKVRKRLDDTVALLARYPLEGLPVPSGDSPRATEVAQIRKYVTQITSWMDQIRPVVAAHEERLRLAQEAGRRASEDRKKAQIEQERQAALRLDQAKWSPINSMVATRTQVENFDDRLTDLEYHFHQLRDNAPNLEGLINEKWVELGYREPSTTREAGEVSPEPPIQPKTNEELSNECKKLQKKLKKHEETVVLGLRELENEQERLLKQRVMCSDLMGDYSKLALRAHELVKGRVSDADRFAKNEAELARLSAQLQECVAARLPPPPPPPTSEEITSELLGSILPDLRGHVQQGLVAIKHGVDDALRKQQEGICSQAYLVLQPALRIVNSVKQYMDRQPELQMPPSLPPQMQTVQH